MVDLSDGEKDNWDDCKLWDVKLWDRWSWDGGKLRWDDRSIQLTWEEEEKVGEMVDKEMKQSFFLFWWDEIWDEKGMKTPTILWDFIYFSSNKLIKIWFMIYDIFWA